MDIIIIGASIFTALVIIIELVAYSTRNMRVTKRAKVRKRLRKYAYLEGGKDGSEILKNRVYSEIPFVNSLLWHTPGVATLDRLLIQADAKFPMGVYILLAFLIAVLSFLFSNILVHNLALSALIGIIFSLLPLLRLLSMKRKRIGKFKKQLPEGLDLIARALKAGHAFTGGMKMATEEMDEPIGAEFSETLDEINFGISVEEALKNLSRRMPCEELKYFVVGVILQRETGGNLAELMATLADLIRERFKFEGKVRILSAEGRISATILIALPFCIAGWIWFSRPEYLMPLITEPIGKLMMALAAVMMAVGIMVMKKMIKITI